MTERTGKVGRIRNSLRAGARAARGTVGCAGPITTDSGVEHDRVVVKVRRDVAARVREDRRGGAPAGGVGVAARDVAGDRAAREEPERDAVRVPEVREHAAAGLVEAVPERAVVALLVRTPRVAVRGAGALDAHDVRLGLRGVVERAAGPGVQRDLVLGVEVHTLWESE